MTYYDLFATFSALQASNYVNGKILYQILVRVHLGPGWQTRQLIPKVFCFVI